MANLDDVKLTVEVEVVYYGPCGKCGLVHGSYQACPDNLNAATRLCEVREIAERLHEALKTNQWLTRSERADLRRLLELVPDIKP